LPGISFPFDANISTLLKPLLPLSSFHPKRGLRRAPRHENSPAQAKAPFPPGPYRVILKKVAPEIKGYPRDGSSWIAGFTPDPDPSFALPLLPVELQSSLSGLSLF